MITTEQPVNQEAHSVNTGLGVMHLLANKGNIIREAQLSRRFVLLRFAASFMLALQDGCNQMALESNFKLFGMFWMDGVWRQGLEQVQHSRAGQTELAPNK